MTSVNQLEFASNNSNELENMLDIQEMLETIDSEDLKMLFAQIAGIPEAEYDSL
jgi:hypothetical protein